jgi:hypothetical protein
MQKIFFEIKNFLRDKIKRNPIAVLWAGVSIFFILLIVGIIVFSSRNAVSVVLSKNTIDDLVDKAANQKYLQKVFNAPDGLKKLPMPKGAKFQPVPEEMRSITSDDKAGVAQRCIYKAQSYVVGDIVKTDEGWVRCTPTIVFVESEEKGKGVIRQAGSPAWTVVQ